MERKKQNLKINVIKKKSWQEADYCIAKFSLPLLKELQQKAKGYPARFETEKEWEKVLSKIIWSLQYVIDRDIALDDRQVLGRWRTRSLRAKFRSSKNQKRMEEGLRLFGKYFNCLWDFGDEENEKS